MKLYNPSVSLFVYRLHQDDPRKCTAARLLRLHEVKPILNIQRISKNAVVLNPLVGEVFCHDDRNYLNHGLIAIDCSWRKLDYRFGRGFKGIHRKLPLLLPANPTNYGHISILSSAEALAAALYIAGCKEQAENLLSTFKWGPNFFILNKNPLDDYSSARSQEQILEIEKAYFERPPRPSR